MREADVIARCMADEYAQRREEGQRKCQRVTKWKGEQIDKLEDLFGDSSKAKI